MAKVNEITIELGLSDKSVQKLRAIAKHAEALANELDAIDNAWECDCGSVDYQDSILCESDTEKVVEHSRECNKCHKVISMLDELPTRLEGSE